jgi:D-tagatose-1,6-bisphosphate aldolase subunit GatZ/KbaZ
MRNACDLVRACVLAGYTKIHLDASMPCADDDLNGPDEKTIAKRAAILCRVAEATFAQLPSVSSPLVYVIGTEVPAPGGELKAATPFHITSPDQVQRTLKLFRSAFAAQNVSSAWERVVGLVVQPGVEFGENMIFDYDRRQTNALSASLPDQPTLVFEAHSTDYQKPAALAEMVADHFAILKVGPWLTFAFREAVFALSEIEREWLGHRRGIQLSQIPEALDAAMLRNPTYWSSYYRGRDDEVRLARMYSYSDRCRYYWCDPTVQQELARLHANLDASTFPLTLVSQYLPREYAAIRSGTLRTRADDIIQEHIRAVLRIYAAACQCGPIRAEH